MHQTIETSLGSLRVEIAGAGPTAVLWHSLFLNNRQWDRVIPSLCRERRLVMIEGPGHGMSEAAVERFTLEDCADAAAGIMDSLDIQRADWVGNAWGGHVGTIMADRYPDRIASLVSIGAPLPAIGASERKHLQVAVWMYKAFGPRAFLANKILETLLAPDVLANDLQAVETVRRAFTEADRKGMGIALDSAMLGRPTITTQFNRLAVPRTTIVGNQDALWSAEMARSCVDETSNSTVVSIDGASHIPPLERPEATAAEILAFWERHPHSARDVA
jgi:pimeloyl-ACP methyl ester carboxylesterase